MIKDKCISVFKKLSLDFDEGHEILAALPRYPMHLAFVLVSRHGIKALKVGLHHFPQALSVVS
jgi:hypothetical protein